MRDTPTFLDLIWSGGHFKVDIMEEALSQCTVS